MTSLQKNSVKTLVIRRARLEDQAFLRQMLYEAAYWRADVERPALEVALTRPDLAKLLSGWGRDGDFAVIANDGRGVRLGAAWMRRWTVDDHSYGFVAADTPECAIGVLREFQRRGVGTALLIALLGSARELGVARVSLSVEHENVARKLYERFGFRMHSQRDGALTMILELEQPAPNTAASPGAPPVSRER